MLSEYPIHTALPATDLERAKRFYADKLGLTPENEGPDGLFYRCGGATRFLVFPSAGTASGTHTQMTWNTPDIEAAVAEACAQAAGPLLTQLSVLEARLLATPLSVRAARVGS